MYLSGEQHLVPNPEHADTQNAIHPTLRADFANLWGLANPAAGTVSTANLDGRFAGRGFLRLELAGADINSVLGPDSLGRSIDVDFAAIPARLAVGGASYALQRADGQGNRGNFNNFSTAPAGDRRFLNHPELLDRANRTDSINADVAPIPDSRTEPMTNAYAMMYIVATGRSSAMARAFSRPTFLGIFELRGP
jgi:hypothetical protein